jgi:predicted outer membrane protein
MQIRLAPWLAIGTAAIALGCATQPPVVTTTTRTTTTTSAGDVALSSAGGWWTDSVGGTWMDSTGALWRGGRTGLSLGLQPADISTLNNANIVAHLATGDSLEVTLSQLGVDRAQNTAVHDFAQRMVTEHSAHLTMSRQMAAQGNIQPMPSPADTADAAVASRIVSRLSSTPAGPEFDRRLMRAEVMMHQHMLHELNAVRPQATGTALELIDHTVPVVRQHLADAQTIWRQVGGGMNSAANP